MFILLLSLMLVLGVSVANVGVSFLANYQNYNSQNFTLIHAMDLYKVLIHIQTDFVKLKSVYYGELHSRGFNLESN